MISRKTTKLLAEIYFDIFKKYSSYSDIHGRSHKSYRMLDDELYDFLYDNDYDAWILNSIKNLKVFETRSLKEFIMRFHTGESITNATPNWSWEQRSKLGQRIIKDLSEDVLNYVFDSSNYVSSEVKQNALKLIPMLELDGYLYRDKILYFSESSIIDVEESHGILSKLIGETNLENQDVIEHHLNLSETHYVNNLWDDCISNSRKFLESILQEVAAKHYAMSSHNPISPSIYDKPFEVRNYLERVGLIETKEKETIAKNYGLLSETGSHPYIAEKDQARLLRYISLTFAEFILLRLKGYLDTI